MSLTFPIDAKLKDGSPVQLVLADNQDIEPLQRLYRIIVEEGTSYAHDHFPEEDAFMDYWFCARARWRGSRWTTPSSISLKMARHAIVAA